MGGDDSSRPCWGPGVWWTGTPIPIRASVMIGCCSFSHSYAGTDLHIMGGVWCMTVERVNIPHVLRHNRQTKVLPSRANGP